MGKQRTPNGLCGFLLTLFAAVGLCLTGCLEQSVVVKVKTDGSGVVHVRKHIQPPSLFFPSSKQDSPTSPSDANVQTLVQKMGQGASLKSLKETKNSSGWPGFDLIIAFDDINHIKLPNDMETYLKAKQDPKTVSPQAPEKPKDPKQPFDFSFAFSDGLLEIQTHGFAGESGNDEPEIEGAIDPFASEPASSGSSLSIPDAAIMQMFAQAMKDARIGFFVQLDGEVVESNAKHRKESLVTLVNVRLGELIENQKAMTGLEQMSENKFSREAAQKLVDSTKGIDADFQEKIQIRFK